MGFRVYGSGFREGTGVLRGSDLETRMIWIHVRDRSYFVGRMGQEDNASSAVISTQDLKMPTYLEAHGTQ